MQGESDVLLTGATGFVGMELLMRYLEQTDRTVFALVRAQDHRAARRRIAAVLRMTLGDAEAHRDRVIPIPGDLEQEGLGLADADRERIIAGAGEIVHCAATVSFTSDWAQSRRINVEGTRHVLGVAKQCAARGVLRRLAHVSTAYVAGCHPGEFGEDDLDVGQRFRNPYERSKYEAEQLVRAAGRHLPAVSIFRPSIIVGESATGWTPAFNVLYVPLRAFAQHRLRVLPADPAAPVDVVPVDHVADAILHVEQESETGVNTYHLVAGERASTVAELVELSARHLHRRPPPLVPATAYRAAYPLLLAGAGRRRRAALRRTAPFLPYYTMRVRYRRERAARVLDPAGLRPPRLETYYDRLVDWALATNWSRQPQPRPGLACAQVRVRT